MATLAPNALSAAWPPPFRPGGPRSHWHQPLLPHDRVSPSTALAATLRHCVRFLLRRMDSAACTLAVWAERDRMRRELAEMSDYLLRDVGLTRADVWAECSKQFWRE